MRIYFSDVLVKNIIDAVSGAHNIYLKEKSAKTRIYSSEGIFHIKDDKLNRVVIKDIPVEHITINNLECMVDRSSINYEVDWFQLSPNHIAETVQVSAYALYNPLSEPIEELFPGSKLVIESVQGEKTSEVYIVNNENNIDNDITNIVVTFLSALNLC